MADLQTLIQQVDSLPREELRQLFTHIKEALEEGVAQQNTDAPEPRIFDLHAGKIWTSDDFDDELPDSFWLGEE
jgi:hypothetical protein